MGFHESWDGYSPRRRGPHLQRRELAFGRFKDAATDGARDHYRNVYASLPFWPDREACEEGGRVRKPNLPQPDPVGADATMWCGAV